MNTDTHTHTNTNTHIHIHTHIYTHTHIHTYVHTYTHTETDTHITHTGQNGKEVNLTELMRTPRPEGSRNSCQCHVPRESSLTAPDPLPWNKLF